MLEKAIYKNHLNETIEMGYGSGIFCSAGDIRDFAYSATTRNGRISAFSKGVVRRTLPVVIACDDWVSGINARNRMFEVMEKDVLSGIHGRLFIDGYYLRCFVTGSAKSDYLYHGRYAKISLTIETDLPEWIRETVFTFGYDGAGASGKDMDFNRDFPSDYTSNLLGRSVCNAGFAASEFRMVVYGAAKDPSVAVQGHVYQVRASLERNEHLTIDSVDKTIILTHADGSQENLFNQRNRESYIFEKVPPGVSLVSLEGCRKADITLLEERSEPRWA